MTYGIDGAEAQDEYVSKAEEAMTYMAAGFEPGRFWVETVPARKPISLYILATTL